MLQEICSKIVHADSDDINDADDDDISAANDYIEASRCHDTDDDDVYIVLDEVDASENTEAAGQDHTPRANGRRRGSGRRRRYDKVLCCFFCQKLVKCKMKRHLVAVHKNETEVARLMTLTDESERRKGFRSLLSRGNFSHNMDVMDSGNGELIYGRRSVKNPRSAADYLPCHHCLQLFLAHDLYRHVRSCPLNNETSPVAQKNVISRARFLLEGAKVGESTKFSTEVLSKIRHDEIRDIIVKDSLILKFGASLHERHGSRRAHDISQKMRHLARLLKQVNSVTQHPICLDQGLSGNRFDDIVAATQAICVFDDNEDGRPLFNVPSFGLKIGHILVQCASLKKGLGIREQSSRRIKDAEDFLALHKSEWTNRVSAAALATFKSRRYNCPQALPLTSDLVRLRDFQKTEIVSLTEKLNASPCTSVWRLLSEHVFTRLVIFNKRRGGETAKLLQSAYTNRPMWQEVACDTIVDSLVPLERKLMQRLILDNEFELFYILLN